jgi:hypothetical protein
MSEQSRSSATSGDVWSYAYCKTRSRYHVFSRVTGRLICAIRADADPQSMGEAEEVARLIAKTPELKRASAELLKHLGH